MKIVSEKFDVIVIGGGPAGMIAAGMAAKTGARVALFEKNNRLGIKLLMTGHGRCNVTNDRSAKEFIDKIGPKGKFLFSALNAFDSQAMMSYLSDCGLELKTENNHRVFPASNQASAVLKVLVLEMEKNGVSVFLNSQVAKLNQKAGRLASLELLNNKIYEAEKFIVATGGLAYPATGSDGDGYRWAKSFGHQIVEPTPGLTAINLEETNIKELEGLSLQNIGARLELAGRNIVLSGDLIFTSAGVSGPLAYDLSLQIGEHARGLKLVLDLFPENSIDDLHKQLQTAFHEEGGKQIKNGLLKFLEPRLVPVVLSLAGIPDTKIQNAILREERQKIAEIMKNFEFTIESLAGFERANVTVGGVELKEIDPKTMQSKLIENLYFAGEILDLAGPTGGFNLQIAWSTGFCAGSN